MYVVWKWFRVFGERLNPATVEISSGDPTNHQTRDMMTKLNCLFESKIDVPRIKVGKKQTIETLINEEALLFAQFLRNERKEWKPRIPKLIP